jgi:hypothetical protein
LLLLAPLCGLQDFDEAELFFLLLAHRDERLALHPALLDLGAGVGLCLLLFEVFQVGELSTHVLVLHHVGRLVENSLDTAALHEVGPLVKELCDGLLVEIECAAVPLVIDIDQSGGDLHLDLALDLQEVGHHGVLRAEVLIEQDAANVDHV